MIKGIPHTSQTKTWDCGLACLSMAMKHLKPDLTEVDMVQACEMYGLDESVWTIDLAYITNILGIKHQFCTETIGVDKNYGNESFYINEMKGSFSEEESRINSRFEQAAENGVVVEKMTVDLKTILDNISQNRPAIVLINDRILRPHLKKLKDFADSRNQHRMILSCIFCCFYWRLTHGRKLEDTSERDYWGHYVIIFGYDMRNRHFILHDPGQDGDFVVCDFTAFQKARTSYGTDGDILFLHPT